MSEKETQDSRYNKLIKTIETQNETMKGMQQEIEGLRKQLQPSKEKSPTPSTSESKTLPERHWTPQDIDDDCPECKKNKALIGQNYVKNLRKERAGAPFVCEGCGLGLQKEEIGADIACPECGSKKGAHKR